jgi:hypothetical protein
MGHLGDPERDAGGLIAFLASMILLPPRQGCHPIKSAKPSTTPLKPVSSAPKISKSYRQKRNESQASD